MNAVLVCAGHEITSTRRSRTAYILLSIFVAMVVASAVIGWITTQVVTGVYEQIRTDGLTTAPNPFTGASPLYFARNSVIYVVLIGSLMAIVLGVEATLRDRTLHTTDLVLTRPVSVGARLLGQVLGVGAVIAAVLVVSITLSWAIISIITGPLDAGRTGRLVAFGALSWVIMMTFALLGMLSGLLSRRETTALLIPFILWSGITFVLPQIGTAARPIALLNPVPALPITGGGFDVLSAITGPLSVTEQFKRIGSILLEDPSVTDGGPLAVVVLLVAFGAMLAAVLTSSRRRMRRPLDD